jgi:hypothetical protein
VTNIGQGIGSGVIAIYAAFLGFRLAAITGDIRSVRWILMKLYAND